MKKHGHYCKVCGEYKANEKFSGKGHAAHVCKPCASLPPEKQAEQMTINRLLNLPWRLSKEQISSVSYTHLDVYKRQVLDVPSERGFCCLYHVLPPQNQIGRAHV